ncbi:MAG: hypothetical protein IJF76_05185 [Clostridia bacterium]|nr:hypothetical protein [Clostridia bacterium]
MIVLCMYDDIFEYGEITVKECVEKYNISLSTFYRYLKVLSKYVKQRRFYNVVYDRKRRSYALKKIKFVD